MLLFSVQNQHPAFGLIDQGEGRLNTLTGTYRPLTLRVLIPSFVVYSRSLVTNMPAQGKRMSIVPRAFYCLGDHVF